jgi:hypothetical protein
MFGRKKRTDDSSSDALPEPSAPTSAAPRIVPASVLWLGDSPMFIDAAQVASFYDAVIRPEFEQDAVVLSSTVTKNTQIEGGLTIGSAFPWVKAEASASVSRGKEQATGDQITLKPVQNAHRQLEHLAFYYLDRDPNGPAARTRTVTCTADELGQVSFEASPAEPPAWNDPEFIQQMPRALLFIDLPANTRFIPTALETVSGEVTKLYDNLAKKFAPEGTTPPKYPGSGPQYMDQRADYWAWFDRSFNDVAAMETVEEAVREERIDWIDYRVGVGTGKQFLHLHVSGRGQYDTGTFAYQLVKRGSKHGLRLVGTLKSEPDMNVLAIFEK